MWQRCSRLTVSFSSSINSIGNDEQGWKRYIRFNGTGPVAVFLDVERNRPVRSGDKNSWTASKWAFAAGIFLSDQPGRSRSRSPRPVSAEETLARCRRKMNKMQSTPSNRTCSSFHGARLGFMQLP